LLNILNVCCFHRHMNSCFFRSASSKDSSLKKEDTAICTVFCLSVYPRLKKNTITAGGLWWLLIFWSFTQLLLWLVLSTFSKFRATKKDKMNLESFRVGTAATETFSHARVCYVCVSSQFKSYPVSANGDTLTGMVTCRPRNLGSTSDREQQICLFF
jgi:hypothetical protein